MKKYLIINGPNLNRTGMREPGIYGTQTLKDIEEMIRKKAKENGDQAAFVCSNFEGEIIEAIHGADGVYDGVILNAGRADALQLCGSATRSRRSARR